MSTAALVSIHDLTLTFGGHPLFDGLSFHIEAGDRFCLLGRNGEGKSTLMRVIAGLQEPDSGEVGRAKGIRVAYLGQDLPSAPGSTVGQFVAATLASDDVPGHVRAATFMEELGLEPEASFQDQSGGTLRRAWLARVLTEEPDLLLLDEPTNHLDIKSITWLENWLLTRRISLILVTHDRSFARKVANRMAELDRGQLYSFRAGYDEFMARREELLEAEARKRTKFDKRLAEEEAWIRRGIKARRTRDEGRVRALVRMREEARTRRNRQGQARLALQEGQKSGDMVAEVQNLGFTWPGTPIVKNLDLLISRGDRIGIVGPNGAGKTTLIRLLLGQLQPQEGTVRLGTRLEPLYLDQLRDQLVPEKSLAWNVAGNDDTVVVGGVARHINAWLQDFLFPPDRADNPVSILSGGERNRLLLAKLFTRSTNLLILDEPTNDLDADTLDLLEDLLAEFQGTLLLVSHDRDFLDNTVTSLLVMDKGTVEEWVGTYSEWEAHRAARSAPVPRLQEKSAAPRKSQERPDRLSYKEERELEALPAAIASLEEEEGIIHAALADPGLYRNDPAKVSEHQGRLKKLSGELAAAYARWEELEARRTP